MPKGMQTAKDLVLAYFEAGEFETAIELINSLGVRLEEARTSSRSWRVLKVWKPKRSREMTL